VAVGEALAAAGEGAAPTQGRAAVHHGFPGEARRNRKVTQVLIPSKNTSLSAIQARVLPPARASVGVDSWLPNRTITDKATPALASGAVDLLLQKRTTMEGIMDKATPALASGAVDSWLPKRIITAGVTAKPTPRSTTGETMAATTVARGGATDGKATGTDTVRPSVVTGMVARLAYLGVARKHSVLPLERGLLAAL